MTLFSISKSGKKIRLSEFYLQTISTAFLQHFGKDDHIWLFGSRVDINKRGGDIDLYVKTMENRAFIADKMKREFILALWQKLGEQKIDVVLNIYPFEHKLPIYKEIEEKGVLLV